MAVDDNGNIHVSYYDYSDGTLDVNLMYGFYDGTDWYTQTIDTNLGNGAVHSTALELDDGVKNCPVILYYSEDTRELRLKYSIANSNPPGTSTPCTWNGEAIVVDTETSGTPYNVYALYSLAVEGAGSSLVTHISYTFYCEDEPDWNGDLLYASFDESEDLSLIHI